MDKPTHLDIRDARDRMIDLLGLGETYPLRDVGASHEVKVAFNKPAQLSIVPAQRGVEYQLRDANATGPESNPDGPLTRTVDGEAVPIAGVGDGGQLDFLSFDVTEDGAYRFVASKHHPLPGGETSIRSVALRQITQIKVGLDVAIPARIVVAGGTVLLSEAKNANSDARLIDYGQTVTVDVVGGQEGVDYQLVVFDGDVESVVSVEDVRGKGEGIEVQLVSQVIYEDVELRIRATKKYTLSEGRATETEILDIIMPLCVRANRALVVEPVPGPVLEYGSTVTVRVSGSQQSAIYQLYAHQISDAEIFPPELRPTHAIDVEVDDGKSVAVQRPEPTELWTTPPDYVTLGEPIAGSGGTITFTLADQVFGHTLIVKATKVHTGGVRSDVALGQMCATLVRPDANRQLAFSVTLYAHETDGTVRISGGQPGVYYQLRVGEQPLGLPVYFHKRDQQQTNFNKGLGQLTIGEDFAVARAPRVGDDLHNDLAAREPASPEVVTGPIAAGTTIHVDALDSITGLRASVVHTAVLGAQAEIRLATAGVDAGSVAQLEIANSQSGDRYQLVHHSVKIGDAVNGDQSTIVLTSLAITQDDQVEIHVDPIDLAGIPVYRIVPVVVPLNPRSDLAIRILGPRLEPELGQFGDLEPKLIDFGGTVEIEVDGSEKDVVYTIVFDAHGEVVELSAAKQGIGHTLTLTSLPVYEDRDIRVVAKRLFFEESSGKAQPTKRIESVLPLKVRANRTVSVSHTDSPAVVFGQPTSLTVASSQASVFYRVHARFLQDSEFLYGDEIAGKGPLLTVAGEGWNPVQIQRPPEYVLWKDLDGFAPLGETVPGNDGELVVSLPEMTGDIVVVLEAYKEHQVENRVVISAVQLAQSHMLLVYPNHAPELVLRTALVNGATDGKVAFSNGEPGIFYQLQHGETPLGQPAYFHQRQADDPSQNKGIDFLRVGLDLVVARDPEVALVDAEARRTTPPPHPLVDTGVLEPPVNLNVLAVRARTGVGNDLEHPAIIRDVPEIRQKGEPKVGDTCHIEVVGSRENERYVVYRSGEAVAGPVIGTGDILALDVGTLNETTTFEVVVVDTNDPLVVERVVGVTIVLT